MKTSATTFDVQRLAARLSESIWSIIEQHPCFYPDEDGYPETRLSGDESPEFVEDFANNFMPLVQVWRAARLAVETGNALDRIDIASTEVTEWSGRSGR